MTPSNFRDVTGQKFNRLLFIKRVENDSSGRTRWECLCDCGVVKSYLMTNVTTGKTKSCGCLAKEVRKDFKGTLLTWNAGEVEFLNANYKTLTIDALAGILGKSVDSVVYRLSSLGLKKRIPATYDKTYFDSLSMESAYWAGFIAADGCVRVTNKYEYRLQLVLKQSELYHIERFKSCIAYSGNIGLYTNNQNYKSASMTIHGAKPLLDSLETIYNITQRKSLTLQPPNITDPELIKAFIIGYIDGDGCFTHTSGGKYLSLSILGTYSFLSWVSEQLFLISGIRVRKLIRCRKDTETYQIIASANKALSIWRSLNCVDVPKLERKWSKGEVFNVY